MPFYRTPHSAHQQLESSIYHLELYIDYGGLWSSNVDILRIFDPYNFIRHNPVCSFHYDLYLENFISGPIQSPLNSRAASQESTIMASKKKKRKSVAKKEQLREADNKQFSDGEKNLASQVFNISQNLW